MMYGFKLTELREKSGLSQDYISRLIHVDRSVYGQYEREDKIIPLKHLNTLCNYYDVSFDFIFEFSPINSYAHSKKNIIKKEVGSRLKKVREERNLTLKEIGYIADCSYGTISGYEHGRYLISTSSLFSICQQYYISADYLLGRIDDPKYLK